MTIELSEGEIKKHLNLWEPLLEGSYLIQELKGFWGVSGMNLEVISVPPVVARYYSVSLTVQYGDRDEIVTLLLGKASSIGILTYAGLALMTFGYTDKEGLKPMRISLDGLSDQELNVAQWEQLTSGIGELWMENPQRTSGTLEIIG